MMVVAFPATLQDYSWPLIQWGAVLGASLAAAVTDYRARRIPNWLTLPVFVMGLAVNTRLAGLPGLLDCILASVMLAAPYVLLFLFAGGGAGDAKLMGALGAWLGTKQGAPTLAIVALVGVLFAVAYAYKKRRLREVSSNLAAGSKALVAPLFGAGSVRDIRDHLPGPKEGLRMPYGIAIFSGILVAAMGRYLWFS